MLLQKLKNDKHNVEQSTNKITKVTYTLMNIKFVLFTFVFNFE